MSGQAWAAARSAADARRLTFSDCCAAGCALFFEAAGCLAPAACGMSIIGSRQGASMTAIGFWFTLTAAFSWGMENVIIRLTTQGDLRFPCFR